MFSNEAESSDRQLELNTRAFIGSSEEDGQSMHVFVEIELNTKEGHPFKITIPPAMAISVAMKILATAHMTVADAFMIEAMHKLQIDPPLISRVVNLVRMKRSAGQG